MAYQPKSYRKFLATSMTAAMVATAVAPITGLAASSFPDVAEGTPYTEPINALAKMKVFEGFNDGTFKIRNKVTRAQAARVLSLIRGFDLTASAAPFPDVKQGVWYSEGINAAYKAGVITGKPSGQFEPNTELTRAEFALMTMQAYGVEPKNDVTLPFTDVKDAWYTEAIKTLYADGVIKGLTTTTFGPNDTIDRGDLAILLYTAEQIYGDGIVGDTQIKAVNNTTVEITYKEEVKGVKASDFEISGLKVENAAIKQSDSKTVVLTTAKQKGGEKYTVKQNGKEIGKFDGISAVIPEKITLAETAIQGEVGKQVTLKADVGVKEAGIPVTFNVQAAAGTLNKSHVEEALTNADGIAEYSYTQYGAGYNDDVAVYPTGAPAQRANAKVFWGVKQILKIEADDKLGDKLNNNDTKAYKVTYNDPKTGNPVPGAKLQVTFVENVNVTVDKTSKATVNGINPVQLTNNTTRTAEVTTDGNGVAKFTVKGTNTKVTPVVFVATNNDNKNLNNDNLRVLAKQLQFGAVQSEYKIEVTRDGGEEAAIGTPNGRKYNVVVKDKDGKPVQNESLNVGFSEDLDRDLNTSTQAYFTKENDNKVMEKDLKYDSRYGKQTVIKLDKDGKASFTIASDKENDYATPVVWVDITSSNTSNPVFNDGVPHQKGAITYFAAEKLTSGLVEVRDEDNKKVKSDKEFVGKEKAKFVYIPANQSGKEYKGAAKPSDLKVKAEFTIYNTGSEDIEVTVGNKTEVVQANRSWPTGTVEGATPTIEIKSKDDKTTSVRVEATGTTSSSTSAFNGIYLGQHKAEAKFKSSKEMNYYTGFVEELFESDKKLKLYGKDKVSYKGATITNEKGAYIDEAKLVELIKNAFAKNKTVELTWKKDGDKITISIVKEEADAPKEYQDQIDVKAAMNKVAEIEELKNKKVVGGNGFNLPTEENGVKVSWKSNKDVLKVADGKVTTDVVKTEETVTLTGTFTKGEAKVTKEFTVKVTPEAAITYDQLKTLIGEARVKAAKKPEDFKDAQTLEILKNKLTKADLISSTDSPEKIKEAYIELKAAYEAAELKDAVAAITVNGNAKAYDLSADGVADTVKITFSKEVAEDKIGKDKFNFVNSDINVDSAIIDSNDSKVVVLTISGTTDLTVGNLNLIAVDSFAKDGGNLAATTITVDAAEAVQNKVILENDSLGIADNEKITGLTSGKTYKVIVGSETFGVKADGTLGDESEAAALDTDVTEITGLQNGKTYKVVEA